MKILLIEDNPDFHSHVLDLLHSRGHQVVLRDSADKALGELNRLSEYDLIILDLIMRLGTILKDDDAEETGIALYKKIRASNKRIPILVLSARKKKRIWGPFRDDPYVKYLGKPVPSDATRFLECVEGGWNE